MAGTERLTLPRAVLFDWDNTLVDSWAVIADALNAALVAMGHEPWTLQQTRERVKASLRDSFPGMFGGRWKEAEKIFYSRFQSHHLERLEALAGAEALLARLAERGVYQGVVSNKRGAFLRKEADHLDWTRFFGRVIGAGDAPRDKPAREPVLMALEGGAIAPGPDVWFVGDTDLDMICARDSGCVPLLVRAQPPQPGEFTAIIGMRHFHSCNELRQLVDKL
ncbi:haloacid dehalogenase [Hypericibacter adhaerens]|uniref:phosphoglycolate phosphatase n=1 Tax=Hypericibacter adhaerens TaxID=2602016 RepID=A0A5J6MYQ2_9PROT|nr:haloacid dehalogenase [Hypericibacter adhaerens]